MSKFLFSALALSAVGATVSASTNDWDKLNDEINTLVSAPALQGSGINMNALLRVNGSFADEDDFGNASGTFGGELDDVDINMRGEVDEFGWHVSADIDGNTGSSLQLQDAYAWWNFSEFISAKFGQFKPKVTHSNSVDPENQVMIDRSVLGSAFDIWDIGVGASGAYEDVEWALNIHNGADGDANDSLYIFRVEYDLGNGASEYEGAYAGGDDLNATVGLAYINDNTTGTADASMFAVDFAGTYNQIGFGVEVASIDDGLAATVNPDWGAANSGAGVGLSADSTYWGVTASYMVNEEWEVALRLQNLDDAADTQLITAGANWFQSGHNAKWQFNVTDVSSDAAASEGTLLQAGLVLGSSR